MIDDIEIGSALSADETSNKTEVTLYPNPASNSVKIYVSLNQLQQVSLVVYDIFGNEIQKIYSGKISDKIFDLNVTTYSKGMYFIKLFNENTSQVRKIVIQ